jgi:hypothetical protein
VKPRAIFIAGVLLAVGTFTAFPVQGSQTASTLEPGSLARAHTIRAQIGARYRALPGGGLAITEASSTGVVESFALLTPDLLETRFLPADNGIYYATCPVRATCPYPARRLARPAADPAPHRLALELALHTFLESSADVVVNPFANTDLTFPALNALASHWAKRDVVVECPASLETWIADKNAGGTWAYTFRDADWTRIKVGLCEAALAAEQPDYGGIEPWVVAIAVHVITHESWHLRLWQGRRDEARVECKAIRSDRRSFLRLGATPDQADDLYSWAWAFHIRQAKLFPEYRLKGCGAKRPGPLSPPPPPPHDGSGPMAAG